MASAAYYKNNVVYIYQWDTRSKYDKITKSWLNDVHKCQIEQVEAFRIQENFEIK